MSFLYNNINNLESCEVYIDEGARKVLSLVNEHIYIIFYRTFSAFWLFKVSHLPVGRLRLILYIVVIGRLIFS